MRVNFFKFENSEKPNLLKMKVFLPAKDEFCLILAITIFLRFVCGQMQILGTGMSTKMWEVTVEHAQTCTLDKRIYLYCSPGSQQRTGVVFNVVGQVMYLLLECEYVPLSKLSETQKVIHLCAWFP